MRFIWLLAALGAFAQTPPLYRFGIEQDRLSGDVDFGFLNHPLTASDRIAVRDGHFYSAAGERVRLFGANLAFGANFPVAADAPRIARRLRKLGINLVRLHHMDSQPDSNPANANSTLTTGPYPTFNDVSIARLRAFLTALAAEGIYVNLNLHVGYTFRPAVDQVPSLTTQSIPSQSKPLHIFHPRMVALQRTYASELIRRLALRDDPVLAMVEIDNESSLAEAWQHGTLDGVLEGEYRDALGTQWNTWLAAKYRTTEALRQAWGSGTADGKDVLPGRFTLEQGHGKVGTLNMVTVDGVPTAQVTPGAGSGWLFLKQTGFQLTQGVRYVWRFDARTDIASTLKVATPVSVMRDVSPWDGTLYSSVTLGSAWQTYTVAVTPSFDIKDSARVSLDVQNATGNVQVRNMSLIPAGERGLNAGETIEARNIALVGPSESASGARMADYANFIVSVDRAYMETIRDAVREAGITAPITGTQMGYGGLSILDSQSGVDYQDNHFYVDHYAFPNTAWDGFDWRIRDSAWADSTWQSLIDMAWSRQFGRPFTVSEFNQPWPNTHGAEIDPVLAAFAAFQDWDGIMHFAYSHSRNWDDGVPNGFNINGDWTKYPMIGQSAWIFRTQAVAAAESVAVAAPTAEDRAAATLRNQSITNWAASQSGLTRELPFTARTGLSVSGKNSVSLRPNPPGELTFDSANKRAVLNSASAAGVFGNVTSGRVTAGPLEIEPVQPGFVAALLTPLNGRELARSTRMLLSLPGYALRTQPGSSQAQKLVNYPGTTDWWTIQTSNARPSGDLNGGQQPTYMSATETWVTLHTQARSIHVTALDGAGSPAGSVPEADISAVPGGFRMHLNGTGGPRSPWFVISTWRQSERE